MSDGMEMVMKGLPTHRTGRGFFGNGKLMGGYIITESVEGDWIRQSLG